MKSMQGQLSPSTRSVLVFLIKNAKCKTMAVFFCTLSLVLCDCLIDGKRNVMWFLFVVLFLSHNQIANTKQVCAETFDSKGGVQEEQTVHLLILRKSLKSECGRLFLFFPPFNLNSSNLQRFLIHTFIYLEGFVTLDMTILYIKLKIQQSNVCRLIPVLYFLFYPV